MANVCLLLCIILLVFGVSGVTFFGEEMPERFGDLQTSKFIALSPVYEYCDVGL